MKSKCLNTELTASFRSTLMISCVGLGLLMASAVHATTLEGLSIDSSGAGLESDGKPVRLIGVHFPNDPVLCGGDSQGCLKLAMDRVESLVDRGDGVLCDVVGVSSAGTHLSSCQLGEDDLGGWLVEHGLAFADRHISRRYVRVERDAREAKRGLWSEVNFGNDEDES